MANFLCICLSSTIQKTISFEQVKLKEVNRSTTYRLDASGKAINTARILTQLNPNTCVSVCPLGEKNANLFMELADQDNLYIDFVSIPGFTRECCTLLDRSKNTTTELVVGEPAVEISEAEYKKTEAKLFKIIESKFPYVDYVLLAGSKPAFWAEDLYPRIAKLCMEQGKFFLADYHGKDLLNSLEVCTPTVIKINEEEFIATFGDGEVTLPEDELKKLIIDTSIRYRNMIVITRGTKPTYAAKDGKFYECPVEKVKPVNTTACGDSFNAGFLHEMSVSGDFEDALKEGTWCAARNAECTCPGSVHSNVL